MYSVVCSISVISSKYYKYRMHQSKKGQKATVTTTKVNTTAKESRKRFQKVGKKYKEKQNKREKLLSRNFNTGWPKNAKC